MIVNHEQRWIYLGVPKTASTALHRTLPSYGGVQVGEWQHDCKVPEKWWGYRVFATSLNPYRRAHGLWRMLQGDFRRGAPWARDAPPAALQDFSAYVFQMLDQPRTDEPENRWPIWRWLEEAPGEVEVEVIAAENLDAGLRRLGILGQEDSIPRINRTQGSNWFDVYDARTEEAVRLWAEEDFRRFGYETDLGVWRQRGRSELRRARLARWRAQWTKPHLAYRIARRIRRTVGATWRAGSGPS